MDNITIIGPQWIEEYLEIYFHAYPAYKLLDKKGKAKLKEKVLRDMGRGEDVDFIGYFEEGKLLAVMKMVNFKMNLYGQLKPAVGLMSLAVHPLHKKKGIAFSMMKYYEDYTKNHGATVAVLLPFDFRFYRKMGYGLGSPMNEYHLRTKNLPSHGSVEYLRILGEDDLDKVFRCYQSFAEKNHGMLQKFSEEIWDIQHDETSLRVGYEKDAELLGYLSYHIEETHETNYTQTRIVVDEMVYSSGEVLLSLLSYLQRQADLSQSVVLRSGEEEFYHLLEDPQDLSLHFIPFGYLQINTSAIANMYKLLEPADFIKETAHRVFPPGAISASFDYVDEMTKEKKSFLLKIQDGKWSTNDGGEIDLKIQCIQADLSSLLMNASRLSSMLRLGVIHCDDDAKALLLDGLLHYGQRPFSNNDF